MAATGIPIPIWSLVNASGAPVSGALINSWIPTTDGSPTATRRTLYTDASLTTPASNPSSAGTSGHKVLYRSPGTSVVITVTSADAGTTYLTVYYGAEIAGGDGSVNVSSFELTGDGVRGTTGIANATDNTFTDASANWTSTDVGKLIVVLGAGVAGASLVTTIASRNSATSIELTTAPSTTVGSNCEYKYGTDNTSAMAALKTYLAAETNVPHVSWPSGFYLYTESPNFFIVDLVIDFIGDVTLCCLSTSGGNGFEIDAGAGEASGYCWNVSIRGAPKIEMLETGGHAVFLRGLSRSVIEVNPRSAGATKACIRGEFLVSCDFSRSCISNNIQQPGGFANGATPAYGIQLTRRAGVEASAHNSWQNVIVEGVTTGVELDYSTGDSFHDGTIEGCTTGIHLTAHCTECRFMGVDVEANTVDLDDDGAIRPRFDFFDADRAVRRTSSFFPKGYIGGLHISNSAGDATNDIDFALGICRDSTDATDIHAITGYTKRLDAAWAAGDDAGGLDTGSISDGTYHCFVIMRNDTGVHDFLFSASATSPTLPADYTYFRRVGTILRDSSAILAFTQNGDEFLLTVPQSDIGVTGPTDDTADLRTLSVASGVSVDALLSFSLTDSTPAAATYALVTSPATTDTQPSSILHTMMLAASGVGVPASVSAQLRLRTNTSAQIRTRVRGSTGDTVIVGTTHGWIDYRGKNS